MKRFALFFLALLLLALPIARAEEENEIVPELLEPVGVKMDSEPVRRGTIFQTVIYEGAVVTESREAYFTVDGKIKDVFVKIGQQVKKGDVLMTLNEEDIQEEADRLTEQIAHERQQNEYACEIARLDIDSQVVDLMRMKDQHEFDQAIRLLEEDIRAAEGRLRQLRESQSLAIEALEDELNAIEGKLGYDEILAPCNGRVAYLKSLSQDDFVAAYDTLVCVTDDESVLIDTLLVSDTMIALAHHYYARVGDGLYDIEIVEANWQENLLISLEGGELRSKFVIQNPDGKIEAGLYACVCLETKYVEDTLIIPKNALNSDLTGRFVYVERDGARVRQNVKVGVTTDREAEITEGLAEGEIVYVKD